MLTNGAVASRHDGGTPTVDDRGGPLLVSEGSRSTTASFTARGGLDTRRRDARGLRDGRTRSFIRRPSCGAVLPTGGSPPSAPPPPPPPGARPDEGGGWHVPVPPTPSPGGPAPRPR